MQDKPFAQQDHKAAIATTRARRITDTAPSPDLGHAAGSHESRPCCLRAKVRPALQLAVDSPVHERRGRYYVDKQLTSNAMQVKINKRSVYAPLRYEANAGKDELPGRIYAYELAQAPARA